MISSFFASKNPSAVVVTHKPSAASTKVVAAEPYHTSIPFNQSLQDEFNKIQDTLRTCWKRRGKWTCDQSYSRNDVVLYQDMLYECIVNETGRSMRSPLEAREQWLSISHRVSTEGGGGERRRMEWDPTQIYRAGNLVEHENQYYLCVVVATTKTNDFNPTEWINLSDINQKKKEEEEVVPLPSQDLVTVPIHIAAESQISGQTVYLTEDQYKAPGFDPKQHQIRIVFADCSSYDKIEIVLVVYISMIKPTSKKRLPTFEESTISIIVDKNTSTNYLLYQDMVLSNHNGSIPFWETHCKLSINTQDGVLLWTPNEIPELGLKYLFCHVKCIGYM